MYFCVLSALSPYGGGPTSLTYDKTNLRFAPVAEVKAQLSQSLVREDDIAELALQLAEEVAPTLAGKLSFADIQILLQDTLRLLSDDQRWLLDFTGRNLYDWQEDDFCYTGLVIGPQGSSPKIQVRRVERYSYDYREWEILVIQCDNGEVRVPETTRYGGKSASFFCWERPYLYFKTWLRFSSPSISDLDDTAFAKKLFLLVDSDHDNCLHCRTVSNLLPCISYGVIKNTEEDGEEELFRTMRVGSKAVADTIAAGKRGCDLWPALAADFGVWMVTRPDVWPPPPLSPA
ncbi:hypothetical protein R3P38DRAFT_3293898 [Favolaschia claudopus]|uniref:Uncharacterized protein n=1 Tax=Favolaschia claudopus TaxID=2862362 RepID=A0AAV9ZGL6_9AGAR